MAYETRSHKVCELLVLLGLTKACIPLLSSYFTAVGSVIFTPYTHGFSFFIEFVLRAYRKEYEYTHAHTQDNRTALGEQTLAVL